MARSYLIFVTKFTCETCGEKSVMWRNFRFLYMANGEESENYSGISDFSTWKMWRIVKSWQLWRNFLFLHMADGKNWNLPRFVTKLVGLWFMLFYCEICFVAICAFFVWRKIEAKNVPCVEKMTNMMYALSDETAPLLRQDPGTGWLLVRITGSSSSKLVSWALKMERNRISDGKEK